MVRQQSSDRAMFDFEEMIKPLPEQTTDRIGDLMLDDFVYGEVSRISPEAPAPILAVTRNDLTVRGAGTLARHLAGPGLLSAPLVVPRAARAGIRRPVPRCGPWPPSPWSSPTSLSTRRARPRARSV